MHNSKKQQGEATRKQILEINARRFAEQGYDGTSLEAIAKEVGVAKSSVLWHFGSKEALLYEVIRGVLGPWEQSQAQELAAILEPKERLAYAIRSWQRLAVEHPDTLLLLLTVMLHGIDSNAELSGKFRDMYRGYRRTIAQAVEFGMQEGVFRRDVQPDEVAGLILGAFQGVFVQWYLDKEQVKLETATESLIRFAVRMLTAQTSPNVEKVVAAPGPTN